MSVRCVALSGGVGGAKLALGLSHCLQGAELAVVGNTGDDFTHLGLAISPDLDTLLYTLAGVVNTETGWGRRDESWNFLAALTELGGEAWFRLGDRDLATHVFRSTGLAAGQGLSEVTQALCSKFGVKTRILPATDDPLATRVQTDDGILAFQEYFVRLGAAPAVRSLEVAGAADARISQELLSLLSEPGLEAVIIAPSNPWLSIDPMLAVPGLTDALRACPAPVIAVSPIVGGAAIKGPTAKIMAELGLEVSAVEVARHYRPWLDAFIIDQVDAPSADQVSELGLAVFNCNTVMKTQADKIALAHACLDFAARLREERR